MTRIGLPTAYRAGTTTLTRADRWTTIRYPSIYLSIPTASMSLSLSTVSTILLACAYDYDDADPRPAPLCSRCELPPSKTSTHCLAVRILLRTTTTNSHLRLNELRRIVTRYLRHRVINLPIESSSPQSTVRATFCQRTPISSASHQRALQHCMEEEDLPQGTSASYKGGKVSRIPAVAPPRARLASLGTHSI